MALESSISSEGSNQHIDPLGDGVKFVDLFASQGGTHAHTVGPQDQSWNWKKDPEDARNFNRFGYQNLSAEQRAFVDRVAEYFPNGAVCREMHNAAIRDAISEIGETKDLSDEALIAYCRREEQYLAKWSMEIQSRQSTIDKGRQDPAEHANVPWMNDPRREQSYRAYDLSDEQRAFVDHCVDRFPPSLYSEKERNQIIDGTIYFAAHQSRGAHFSEQEYCSLVQQQIEAERQTETKPGDVVGAIGNAADFAGAKTMGKLLGSAATGLEIGDATRQLLFGNWGSQWNTAPTFLCVGAPGVADVVCGAIAPLAMQPQEKYAWARAAVDSFYFDNPSVADNMQAEAQRYANGNQQKMPWSLSAFSHQDTIGTMFENIGSGIAAGANQATASFRHDALLPQESQFVQTENAHYRTMYEAINPYEKDFVDRCAAQFPSPAFSSEERDIVIRAAIEQAVHNNSIDYDDHRSEKEFCDLISKTIDKQRQQEQEISNTALYNQLSPEQKAFVDRCTHHFDFPVRLFSEEEYKIIQRAAISQALLNCVSPEDEMSFYSQVDKFIDKWDRSQSHDLRSTPN